MAEPLSLVLTVINTLISALSIYINPQNFEGLTVSVPNEINSFGYPAETHLLTSEDGYILGLHRIPYSPKFRSQQKKPAVFLQHGIGSCSADWISNGPDKGLAYILADLGYDVWLGNVRGNTYSRNHTTLDPDKDSAFWDFSVHEHGVYDLPANIDYILDVTGQPNLFYIGFSQGTRAFFVMTSERPEYNAKIRAMFGLAPAATLTHAESPMVRMAKALNLSPQQWQNLLGIREVFPNSPQYVNFVNKFCLSRPFFQVVCETGLFIFVGFDREQMNTTLLLPEIARHAPSGASSKQGLHNLQGIASGKFRKYDYGRRGNLLRYGTEEPPAYNTSRITAPVSLHHGSNDWLASVKGVELFYKELVNPIGKFLVPYPNFNHLDFLHAKDAKALVYDHVTYLMSLY